jgi:hypothetical protein
VRGSTWPTALLPIARWSFSAGASERGREAAEGILPSKSVWVRRTGASSALDRPASIRDPP